jgi:uncharacterized protein YukE
MVRQYNQRVKQHVDRINREIDRVNRANRQAADQYNRQVQRYNSEVDRHRRQINQNAARAVAQYNQAVRAYNSAARSDNQRLQRQITAMRSRPTVVRYQTVVTRTVQLHEQYERARSEAAVSGGYEDLIVLAEREAANSADVSDALTGDEEAAPPTEETGILDYLAGLSQDLCDRWRGAVYALSPSNPDAARHFCTSAREIFHEILQRWAADSDVEQADPGCARTPQGTPTRRAKINFMLRQKNVTAPELATFVDADVDNIVELFGVFNEATHGEAGKHAFAKLQAIRKRVEGGIMFLAAVAT